MRTESIQIFKASELPHPVKSKVLDRFRFEFCEWFDDVIKEDAEQCSNIDILEYDLEKDYIQCKFKISAKDTAQTILENHGEICPSYSAAHAFLSALSSLESLEDTYKNKLIDELEKGFMDQMSNYYLNMLQDQYDYLTSDENIINSLDENNYEFLENGKRY